MKKQYKRKCIVTNNIISIDELLRFSINKNKEISVDFHKNLPGRGAYVTNKKEIIEILFKKKLLNKAFKNNIPKEKYAKLMEEIFKNE
ncbi:YlxR family protein [Mesomycoplasma neurolyticum]|uniref:Transciprtional termination factor n=1 Tax=Mesomycoplasma neurolyticum TaxID=2120 RepID=A0A449A6G9_9BACT|nr:YlxR family protein [Mesomycoplasma neurolyticum]VEU59822.1 Putative transciprtional termination factor [Mesomycoplasma neurolyticum]